MLLTFPLDLTMIQELQQGVSHGLELVGTQRTDLDRLITGLLYRGTPLGSDCGEGVTASQTTLGCLIGLRGYLISSLSLTQALEDAQAPLLRAIRQFLEVPGLQSILCILKNCLNEDILGGKGALEQTNARVYAVKVRRSCVEFCRPTTNTQAPRLRWAGRSRPSLGRCSQYLQGELGGGDQSRTGSCGSVGPAPRSFQVMPLSMIPFPHLRR
ncbi:hypothetical protein BCV69DRAFT_108313 [Microstroma glucosiphilum]|uniref:Uncharacterized protein n=1 Tax=Pseudomicrostroma glucosiphilum TaxID=1684307 RepID=A0A316UFC0_9BASI|nr:hypothetical protein BCV69DRAFT_108313 [Pseudomicrostroma glucosiphilum]PWN23111.1 hypothetical protein BCV69DRAFT_108313 [Pseudomicrostroma glucosiphilum]